MSSSKHRALAAIAVVAITVATGVPAIAATPGPKGTLTALEYRQLTTQQAAFKKLKHDKSLTWNDLYAACRDVGRSTPLLQSIRANCQTGVGIDQSLAGFYSDLERCAALSTGTGTSTTTTPTGTTTTGTTTTTTTTTTSTGTGTTTTGTLTASDLKLFACMQPEYAVFSRAVRSVYRSQATLRRQVLVRAFAGRCELTLAPTDQQLRDLRRWTATAKQLAADVTLISEVANGQRPASAVDDSQVQADAVAFDSAAKTFERTRRPQNLSVCPRQR